MFMNPPKLPKISIPAPKIQKSVDFWDVKAKPKFFEIFDKILKIFIFEETNFNNYLAALNLV
jgi:hypothetical protein